jgi:hypothetical protein
MQSIRRDAQFKRDVKRLKKRQKDFDSKKQDFMDIKFAQISTSHLLALRLSLLPTSTVTPNVVLEQLSRAAAGFHKFFIEKFIQPFAFRLLSLFPPYILYPEPSTVPPFRFPA